MPKEIEITKASLLDRLYSNHLTVWYLLFITQAVQFIREKPEITIKTNRGEFSSKELIQHLENDENETLVRNMAATSSCRNYLKENFRIMKEYCFQTNQLDKLQDQEWYLFAKLLVNCISHDMVFNLKSVTGLPVSYENYTIDMSLDEQHLPDNFTAQLFINLGEDIFNFAINGGLE